MFDVSVSEPEAGYGLILSESENGFDSFGIRAVADGFFSVLQGILAAVAFLVEKGAGQEEVGVRGVA